MKKINKILIVCLTLFVSIILVGCGKNSKPIEGSLEDLMDKVYEAIPEDERPMALGNTEVTKENIEYYLGTSDITFKEAIASESKVGSIAHSIVLIRTNEGQDIDELKTKIKENVNPRKWICVSVEDENVIVESNGDLVILIMTENHPQELLKNFKNLK